MTHVHYAGGRYLDLDEYREFLDRFGDEDMCRPCNEGRHHACVGQGCACWETVDEEETA